MFRLDISILLTNNMEKCRLHGFEDITYQHSSTSRVLGVESTTAWIKSIKSLVYTKTERRWLFLVAVVEMAGLDCIYRRGS